MNNVVDIIIIGGGIAGLYAAYQIKRMAPPNTTFLVLEKNPRQWLGGRAGNETFYGANIVVGAGVGRKDKDHALIKLLKDTKPHIRIHIIAYLCSTSTIPTRRYHERHATTQMRIQ